MLKGGMYPIHEVTRTASLPYLTIYSFGSMSAVERTISAYYFQSCFHRIRQVSKEEVAMPL